MNIQELITELERQKPMKWDQTVTSDNLTMTVEGSTPRISLGNGSYYGITSSCHAQIAERLEIPLKYYHRMMAESPELLAENTNT